MTTAPVTVLMLDWSEAEELDRREQEADLRAECLERLYRAMRDAVRAESQLFNAYELIHDKTTTQAVVLRQRMATARQATADATYAWRCAR